MTETFRRLAAEAAAREAAMTPAERAEREAKERHEKECEHVQRLRETGMPLFQAEEGAPALAPTFARVARVVEKSVLAKVEQLTRSSAILCGPSGYGKTRAAAAWMDREVRAGRNCLWLYVDELEAEHRDPRDWARLVERVRHYDVVVLDDWGSEFRGAEPGTGLAAMRMPPVAEILSARYKSRKGFFITTGMTYHRVLSYYGDALIRRAHESAHESVIDFGDAAMAKSWSDPFGEGALR